MKAAYVDQLWRYPVASIGGERVMKLAVGPQGVEGDRQFLLVDLNSGEVAAPEKLPRWRPALQLRASSDGSSVLVESSEWSFCSEDSCLDHAISELLGFRCGIRQAGSQATVSQGSMEVRSRYKAAPLHLISKTTLDELQTSLPASQVDVRRFRPNVVIAGDCDERTWLGHAMAIGSFTGTVTETTKRCGMTMVAQPGCAEDPEILRAIIRRHGRHLGVYAGVTTSGVISVSDDVRVS